MHESYSAKTPEITSKPRDRLPPPVNILGVDIDRLSMDEVRRVIQGWLEQPFTRPRVVVTANTEMVIMAVHNPELLSAIQSADLRTADGRGIVWASAILGERLPGRCAGIDLMYGLVRYAAANGLKIFLLGGRQGVAAKAAENLKTRFPGLKIAGTHHGYFFDGGESEVVAIIRDARPDILFVGLGVPRQEIWMQEHRDCLPVKVMIGVGGSLDIIAGRLRRAPRWMQEVGLEWLFRVLQEPKRFPRVLALPRFVLAVLMDKFTRGVIR